MTIQQLRCFLAVAKTLNYTQAAQEVFVSQSAISKQIQMLEQELQLQLFRRDHHSVALTPAGAFLAEQVSTLQRQMDKAVECAQAMATESQVQFRLAVLPFLDIKRIAPSLFDDFVQACPGCKLDIVSFPLEELLDAFYCKQVNAILIRSFDTVKGCSLVRYPISRGKTLIYFSRKMFPNREEFLNLRPQDFNGTTVFLQTHSRYDYSHRPNVFRKNYGFLPGDIRYVASWDTIISQVYLGYGVTLAGPSFRITREEDLLNVPTYGRCSDSGIDVVWSTDQKNPSLWAFQQVIRHMKRLNVSVE
ncbi:LysR family transcriptional regulator [Caproicibacterium sp. NSD3]